MSWRTEPIHDYYRTLEDYNAMLERWEAKYGSGAQTQPVVEAVPADTPRRKPTHTYHTYWYKDKFGRRIPATDVTTTTYAYVKDGVFYPGGKYTTSGLAINKRNQQAAQQRIAKRQEDERVKALVRLRSIEKQKREEAAVKFILRSQENFKKKQAEEKRLRAEAANAQRSAEVQAYWKHRPTYGRAEDRYKNVKLVTREQAGLPPLTQDQIEDAKALRQLMSMHSVKWASEK